MPSPYRSLPPLATLRTFEAVARQLSFTRAAEELALTQSAVSHQIHALEEHLGASLFASCTPRPSAVRRPSLGTGARRERLPCSGPPRKPCCRRQTSSRLCDRRAANLVIWPKARQTPHPRSR